MDLSRYDRYDYVTYTVNNKYVITLDHFTNNDGEMIQVFLHDHEKKEKEIGFLNSYVDEKNQKRYANIRGIQIHPSHRKQGLGVLMYKSIIEYSDKLDIDGIISYLNRRINNKEIPHIYKKLGSITKDGFAIIEF